MLVGTIDGGEPYALTEPGHLDEMIARDSLRIAIHLLEQGLVAAAPRILLEFRCPGIQVVLESEHVLDICIVKFLHERFLPAVVISHFRAVVE